MESLTAANFYILGLILLLPLLGALFNGLLGNRLPKQVVWLVACGTVGLAFALALFSVSTMWNSSELETVGHGEEEHETIKAPALRWTAFEWINTGDWTEGEAAYIPAEQFSVYESQSYERCCRVFGDSPDWAESCQLQAGDCLSAVYTPTMQDPDQGKRALGLAAAQIAEDGLTLEVVQDFLSASSPTQSGIGGVRARLKRNSHRFGAVDVSMSFVLDNLSAVMLLIILGVGFLIHVYSVGYMRHDKSKARYFSYLNLFIFAMLILVLADSLVVMFVGWEGVGLCSYLLIGFNHEHHANADAGKKAFIVNRVGDFAFVIGILTLFFAFGTFEFAGLQKAVSSGLTPELLGLITVACILMFIGCTGKSAQIPLYVWLPDAMAGPTPVSALIHAATMVTAGVYLVARLHFLFILSPTAMAVVAVIGGATALFAATIAITQTDIKKVLAYSTVSQLGYMFLAVGVGAWWVGIFHLLTHAFFKALLFLGSGSVIDGMHHEQDIRMMGGLRKKMPVTAVTFLIGCLAIAGVPLLAGFFSKDQILWYAWFNQFPGTTGAILSWVLWGVGTLTAGLTAFYMFRLYFVTFEGECRAGEELAPTISESPTSMTVPLTALALLAIVAGYLGMPHLLSGGNLSLETLQLWLNSVLTSSPAAPGTPEALSRISYQELTHTTELAWEWGLMALSVVVAFAGMALAYFMYVKRPSVAVDMASRFAGLHRWSSNKYYVDELYDKTAIRGTLWLGKISHSVIDVILIDFLMVRGAAWLYEMGGSMLKYFQNGDLQRYAAYVMLGMVAILYLVLL